MAKPQEPENFKVIAQNRRASFDFEILEKFEAGLTLKGSEVKSLRRGKASIAESHAAFKGGILYLLNATIEEYKSAIYFGHDSKRPRPLLLHKKELRRLEGAVTRKGLTLVPMTLYFNHKGIAKLSLALARGKNKADKRQTEKERDFNRDRARGFKED